MGPRSSLLSVRTIVAVLATAVVYFVLGRLAILLAIPPGVASAVWPASGFALAVVLLAGYRVWPGILLGSFFVNVGTLWSGTSPVVALLVTFGIAVGSVLQAVVSAYLVKRVTGTNNPMNRGRDVLLFVGIEVLTCSIAPYFGVTSLCLSGMTAWSNYDVTWWTWWIGDFIGVLVIAPLILTWSRLPPIRWKPRRFLEGAAMLLGLVIASQLVFGAPLHIDNPRISVPTLLTPLIIWAAFRFGQPGVTIMLLLSSGLALWGTIRGIGLFAHGAGSQALPFVQTYVGVQSLIGLVLAALLDERKKAEDGLRHAHDSLEMHVRHRTSELQQANESLQAEITNHQHSLDSLRMSEERIRILVEGVHDYAIFMLNPQGYVATWNAGAERIKGYLADEIIGKHFSCFYPAEAIARSRPEHALSEAGSAGRFEDEGWRVRKDGTQFWANVVITVLKDKEGTLKGFSKITRDLTERKRTETALRNSERLAAIGEMITGLAHESRNALQRSQSCLEMLLREVENRPRARDLVERIQDAQDHLHHLYETVRTYAAPIVLNFHKSHLGTILQETWENVVPLRQGKQATLHAAVGDVDLRCWIDPIAIGQVLRNILENSLQVCGDSPEIQVHWSETRVGVRAALRISLRDNGPGLTKEQRTRIFEPFYTTKTHGTGLGMAISKRIIEAHGGQIEVGDNNTPGAEIQITLPREREG